METVQFIQTTPQQLEDAIGKGIKTHLDDSRKQIAKIEKEIKIILQLLSYLLEKDKQEVLQNQRKKIGYKKY